VIAVLLAGLLAASGGTQGQTLSLTHMRAPTVAGHRVASYQDAVRAFGMPTHVLSSCDALWSRIGLEVDSCRQLGIEVTATTKAWHTAAGLRVGDTTKRTHSLYPQGRSLDFLGRGALWQLETGGLMCDGGPTLALAAKLAAGHVTALETVVVPACG
jgi:hypothetical protein